MWAIVWMEGSRQCIAISKVISGGSEQRLILTTESKVRSGSGENISESFFPAAGEKVGTKDAGRRRPQLLFFDHEYGDLQTERKKVGRRRRNGEREVLLYFRFFFLSSIPRMSKKWTDGGPLKQKFKPKPSFGGAWGLLFTV